MTTPIEHEPPAQLSAESLDQSRATVSLMEELEAVDWYSQRAEACTDPDLQAVLIHNKNEEVEHAMMLLEWLRRKSPVIDSQARKYLFSSDAIVGAQSPVGPNAGCLGIGSLKGTPT
jgi:ferritin-like protein